MAMNDSDFDDSDSDDWDYGHLVFDVGANTTKCGFSNDCTNVGYASNSSFPTLIGRSKAHWGNTNVYVSSSALSKAERLDFSRPYARGKVVNWDDMERIWKFAFHESLRGFPLSEKNLLISESFLTTKADREKTAELMFEKYDHPGLSFQLSEELSLLGSGRQNGLVVSSGYDTTYAVPIVEGKAIRECVSHSLIGGQDVTGFMKTLNQELRISDHNCYGSCLADLIKGTFTSVLPISPSIICSTLSNMWGDERKEVSKIITEYIPPAYADYTSRPYAYRIPYHKWDYIIEPTHRNIPINLEQLLGPELLFQTSLFEDTKECDSVQEITYHALSQCEDSIQDTLCKNIVLSGGNTLFPGYADRLKNELIAMGSNVSGEIVSAQNSYSTWIGGCVLCNMPEFKQQWVKKEEYEEHGPSILLRQPM